MPHIHWVARQNKLEIPNDEEEVNTREIHQCDGQRWILTSNTRLMDLDNDAE